jgi:hypothetical protein
VVLVLFGALEGTYQAVAPEGSSDASGNSPYQLSYTVSEWSETQTLSLDDGETQTFEVVIDESMTAVLIAELTVTYSETTETGTSNCDDVITSPDYSDLTGPFSESDDAERSTNACGQTTLVGSIRPNTDLNRYAAEGTGDYTLNGSERELLEVLTTLGKAPEMVGTLSMDVSLSTNNGNPFFAEGGETVTVTLTMLVFQPSGMTPVTG